MDDAAPASRGLFRRGGAGGAAPALAPRRLAAGLARPGGRKRERPATRAAHGGFVMWAKTARALCLWAAMGPAAALAQPAAPSFEAVIEGARKERALVVRLSSPGRPETH